jgi:hypothetical protein
VRWGAASCRAVLRSCPGCAAAGVVTAERSSVAERRRRCNPSEVGPPSRRRRRRGRRGCPDAGHAVRRSLRRADVRPPGRVDVRCPGDRCPPDRCDPGVRTARRPVSVASASALSGTALDPGRRCRGTGHVGGPGSTCRGGPERPGRRRPNPAWRGRMVKRWQCVAGHEGRRQTRAVASRSHRLGRRARRLADQGSWSTAPGCRSVGWGAREGAGAHRSPAGVSWAGCRRAARHGAGPEGGDHARWSLRWRWSGVVRRWRARPVQRGVDCGRAAAAACETRCPLGADSTLTS